MVFGQVRELVAPGDVANRVDVWIGRAQPGVDDDLPVRKGYVRSVEAQISTLGRRPAARSR